MDGPVPQPGITSVAVEQGIDEMPQEMKQLSFEERPERMQLLPLDPGEYITPHVVPIEVVKDASMFSQYEAVPALEQQLAFLQYLVRRGTFNEGFSDGDIPEQYKQMHSQESGTQL